MINIIRALLKQITDDIDAGNSNINESEQEEVIKLLQKIYSKRLSTTQAADYIGVCRSTFENYVQKGLIPKGFKQQGVHGLFWYKSDLDKYLKENVKNVRKRL